MVNNSEVSFVQAQQKVRSLTKKINRWSYYYYVLNRSLVSDHRFDQAIKELKNLETRWPALQTSNSPTQTVGADPSTSFAPSQHAVRMLSLKNAFSYDELLQFDTTVRKATGLKVVDYVCELKIDGLSINCRYQDSQLIVSATRGNGIIGEDITLNTFQISDVLFDLLTPHLNCEIRGEVFFFRNDFQKLNQVRQHTNQPLFANARNAAAGTLRTLDHQVVRQRRLSIFFYDVLFYDQQHISDQLSTQIKILNWLQAQKFRVNPHFICAHGLDSVIKFIDRFEKQRHSLGYEIDGVVIKVNDRLLCRQLGATAKAPRWAIAYKFPPNRKETQLLDIFPTVGRTGKITYNAKLKPVHLDGTLVRRATLHNADYIQGKDIRINDYVFIHKAGDIIPEITQFNLQLRSKKNCLPWKPARFCPNCGESIVKKASDADQYCSNSTCLEQKIRQIIFFCSKEAMNIKGISRKTIVKLYKHKLISCSWDLYRLTDLKLKLLKIPGFQTKLVTNLLSSISRSKQTTWTQILVSLGISYVGVATARQLMNHFSTIKELSQTTIDQLIQIEGIGPETAAIIVQFWSEPKNQKLISLWKEIGIQVPRKLVANHHLNGLVFLFSGQLLQPRSYYHDLIVQQGGQVSNHWNLSVDYLVVGSKPGSKFQKAVTSGIKIINEQKLKTMLKT